MSASQKFEAAKFDSRSFRDDPDVVATAHELGVKDRTIRIVGSIARRAFLGQQISSIKSNGLRTDIDLFHLRPVEPHRVNRELIEQYPDIDNVFDHWIRTEENGSTYLTFPTLPDDKFQVPEADIVFDKRTVPIGASSIQTVNPEVLARINHLMYIMRPKDKAAFQEFDNYVGSLEYQTVHPDLLMPFESFQKFVSMQKAYLLKAQLRNKIYIPLTTETMRKKISLGSRINWLKVAREADEIS